MLWGEDGDESRVSHPSQRSPDLDVFEGTNVTAEQQWQNPVSFRALFAFCLLQTDIIFFVVLFPFTSTSPPAHGARRAQISLRHAEVLG